jgi:hypothetical protein
MAKLPCRIVLEGELSERFHPGFGGLLIRHEAEYTELTGTLADHAQLHSILDRIFDLGMEIVSVDTRTAMPSLVIDPRGTGDDA